MKTRTGFVSNSSSSSFIIIVKKGELTHSLLNKVFNLPKNHPLHNISSSIVSTLIDNAKQKYKKSYIDNGFEEDDIPELAKKAFSLKYKVYEGSCSDDCGDGVESFLNQEGLNSYEDNTIIIEME